MTRDTQPAVDGFNFDAQVFSALWAAQASSFPHLPPDAPSELQKATVDVKDPERVYSIYRASRRYHFQLLVERYEEVLLGRRSAILTACIGLYCRYDTAAACLAVRHDHASHIADAWRARSLFGDTMRPAPEPLLAIWRVKTIQNPLFART